MDVKNKERINIKENFFLNIFIKVELQFKEVYWT